MKVWVFINVLTGEIVLRNKFEQPFGGGWMLKGISRITFWADDGSEIPFEEE